VQGGGGQTAADTGGGAATIAVTECGWYNQAGGTCLIEQSEVTYTGVSAASGPGALTGCSGLAHDVAAGVDVDLLVTADSGGGQTALAAALATTHAGHSGIATHYVVDRRLSLSEATARASAELTFYSQSEKSLSYAIEQSRNGQALHTLPGKSVSVNFSSSPETVVATFRIQQVTFTLSAPFVTGAGAVEFNRAVSMQVHRRSLVDLLSQLR
jgi:hypothetical protein